MQSFNPTTNAAQVQFALAVHSVQYGVRISSKQGLKKFRRCFKSHFLEDPLIDSGNRVTLRLPPRQLSSRGCSYPQTQNILSTRRDPKTNYKLFSKQILNRCNNKEDIVDDLGEKLLLIELYVVLNEFRYRIIRKKYEVSRL
jgi:hypothetical protein